MAPLRLWAARLAPACAAGARGAVLAVKAADPPEPEFSRVAAVGNEKRVRIELLATADECAALAARFGWSSLEGLKATVMLARVDSRDRHRVAGKMSGVLTRKGASGESVTLTVTAEEFESFYREGNFSHLFC